MVSFTIGREVINKYYHIRYIKYTSIQLCRVYPSNCIEYAPSMLVMKASDCLGTCESGYNMIEITTAPHHWIFLILKQDCKLLSMHGTSYDLWHYIRTPPTMVHAALYARYQLSFMALFYAQYQLWPITLSMDCTNYGPWHSLCTVPTFLCYFRPVLWYFQFLDIM